MSVEKLHPGRLLVSMIGVDAAKEHTILEIMLLITKGKDSCYAALEAMMGLCSTSGGEPCCWSKESDAGEDSYIGGGRCRNLLFCRAKVKFLSPCWMLCSA